MANNLVRELARSKGVKLWQIAERLPLSDANFSRKLRRELPEAEREKVLGIIEQIAREKEAAG